MTSEKTPNTTEFIREIQKLARLADELSCSAREMGAELDQLKHLLCIKQQFIYHASSARTSKPN
jgi:hypothetical protein